MNNQLPISIEVENLCGESYSLHMEKQRIFQATIDEMEIVRGNETTLLFDLDGEHELDVFKARVGILERKGFVPHIVITKSKHSNYHAVVTITSTSPLEEPIRIAI